MAREKVLTEVVYARVSKKLKQGISKAAKKTKMRSGKYVRTVLEADVKVTLGK